MNEQCGNRLEAVVVLYNVYNELSCQSIDLKAGLLVQSLTVLHKCGYHLVINTQDKPMEACSTACFCCYSLGTVPGFDIRAKKQIRPSLDLRQCLNLVIYWT